jgi:Tfp pilus assembly protein PilF
LDTATNLSQDKQFDAAIAAYETVERVKPQEVRALQGLGRAYEAKGAWGEAAAWYEKWTQVATEDKSAFLALSDARLNLREYERAVAAYERAKVLGAGSTGMDAHLGLAYFELAQYNKAAEHLQPAVGQNSEDFELQRALGLSLYSLDQPEQAMEYLNKAVALGADRSGEELADLYYALGGCHFALQDYGQAIRFYEQAQELEPEGRSVWAGEAQANLDEAYARLAPLVMKSALLDLDFSNVVTEGGETYAIARAGQRVEIGGPVRLVEGPWEGSQALVVEEGTTNECRDPSFEIDATYWAPASLGSVARTTDDARYGGASLRCSSGGGQSYAQACYVEGVTTFNAAVGYAVSAWYKLENLPAGGDISFLAHWNGGAHDNATTGVMVGTSEGGGWHYVSTVLTPDYGDRTEAGFYLSIEGATADGQSFLLDGFQVEQGRDYSTSYCDGDQGEAYSWSGIPHGSTSVRPAAAVAVGTAGNINPAAGTMAIWFRFSGDEISHIRGIWSNHTAVNDRLQLFACSPSADRITLFRNVGSGNEVLASITTTIDTDWHHLVWSWDTSGSRLYLDGSLQATYDGNAWSGVTLAPGMYLGCEVYDLPAYLNGVFAKFAVFNRVLTAEEIGALYGIDAPASTY